jgi:ADP-ribosylglycohydrolase
MPIADARVSLQGLAVGDAFGSALEAVGDALVKRVTMRLIPVRQRPWRWTDDTAMGLSIVEVLEHHGTIDTDALAAAFGRRFASEPGRGYGAAAYGILHRIAEGADWRSEARRVFDGRGSYGNGAAMRAAPIGACFAPDLERVRAEALRSAEPTHAHPDGAAGAVAVALAAALAQMHAPRDAIIPRVIELTPSSPTRDRLVRAHELGLDADPMLTGEELGTGANITSRDTVPFCVWIAARHLASFEDALWASAGWLGTDSARRMSVLPIFECDRDTVGAIVGGIVACAVGLDGIPLLWREATEKLPTAMSA